MKFVFEAKASDYDLAAEQEICWAQATIPNPTWPRPSNPPPPSCRAISLSSSGQPGRRRPYSPGGGPPRGSVPRSSIGSTRAATPAFFTRLSTGRGDKRPTAPSKVYRVLISPSTAAALKFTASTAMPRVAFQKSKPWAREPAPFRVAAAAGIPTEYCAPPKHAPRERSVEESRLRR